MKKWILIIIGIILIGIIGIGIKINSDFDDLAEAYNSEHSLDEPNLNILYESKSPNEKYKYYEYQFDKGALGYSRVFWSVIENNESRNDLKSGLIPIGYKIIGWNDDSELKLQKWKPYYESNTTYELDNKTKFNGIRIHISNTELKSKIEKKEKENTSIVSDTISNWRVYNGGKLLKAFNAFSTDNRILLTKGKIRAIDTVDIKYFDDTPCIDCTASLTIKTDKNKGIKRLDNSLSNYNFKIKTTDLQVLAFQNKSSVLKFYYKEDETDDEVLLFEIEIR